MIGVNITNTTLRRNKKTLLLKLTVLVVMLCLTSWSGILKNEYPKETRKKININAGWQYLENNTDQISEAKQSLLWKNIDLPHTWNQWDAVDQIPGYRRDASWYRKTLNIESKNKSRYILYFEGSNITSEVFVNGKKAGSHVGGYVGFQIDITDFVMKGKTNTLMIRVDNSYNPEIIPSQKADFIIYGGITRDLWLNIIPDVHVSDMFISTPVVSSEMAKVKVRVKLSDFKINSKDCKLIISIYDPQKNKLISSSDYYPVSTAESLEFDLPKILNPKLWSPDQPNLYKMNVILFFKGKLVDMTEENFGLRWFHFDDFGPFYLNGKKLLLRGTHRHEEYAGFGAAMPNELHRKDMEMIKEMGANFIRLGHYPQDPEVYKACDELGLIVWDELPWCRGGIGNAAWQSNTSRLLKEQILQNYNHPSIVFWALGNEVYWLPDFPGGDDINKMNPYISYLNKIAHDLDPGRMTSIRKYYEGADLVDVFSPSIWSGWYAGVYTNYGPTLTKNQALYKRFLHMEYGGSSHVGRHTENPVSGDGMINEDEWAEVSNQLGVANIAQTGDWTENYIVDLFDWYLHVSESQTGFAGSAQWAFKDFATPLRPENGIPYMNQKGLVDREGRPKDSYYVFKSYWAKEPFAYIESHTWLDRSGPVGKKREISVFSNCKEVELFHNGTSLGKKMKHKDTFPAGGLTWEVLFNEGNNSLRAIGISENNSTVYDSISVHYTYKKSGIADHINLNQIKLDNGNYLVEATMQDKNNQRVLDYEGRIYFTHDGSGKLMVDYGVPDKSQVIEMANGRAVIQVIPGTGKAVFEVRNQDFKGSYLVIDDTQEASSLIIDGNSKNQRK